MRPLQRLVERARRIPPLVLDGALALGVLTYGVLELTVFSVGKATVPPLPPYHLNGWSVLVFAMMSLPLALRRRNMLLTYALIQAATLGGILAHVETNLLYEAGFVLMIVLIFAVADRAPAWVAVLAAFAQVGILLLTFEISNPIPNPSLVHDYLLGIILFFPWWAFPLFLGWAQRRRRALTVRLETRAEELRQERERIAAQAIVGERVRIAQELQALVSRGIEVMTEQAGAARMGLGVGSASAPDEITAVESTGRRTLVEMRRLLHVLRGPEARRVEPVGVDPPVADPETETSAPDHNRTHHLLWGLSAWLRIPWIVDIGMVVLAVVLFLWRPTAGWLALWGNLTQGGIQRVLTPLILGVLVLRSRVPFTVLCVISGAVFVWLLVAGDTQSWTELATFLAAYSVAASKEPRWAVAAVALVVFSWSPYPFTPLCSGLCLFDFGILGIFAVTAGVAVRVGRRINRELQEVTDILVRTREERIRLAVVEERTRVARDLHDVVAHALTVMVVQAGAARALSVRKPARARESLAAVEHAGQEAIDELDSLFGQLGLIGVVSAASLVEPESRNMASLVDGAIQAGLRAELLTDGEPGPLDAGLELAVFRIVQEALTNVRKHAPGARAWVEVRYRPDAVEIEVTDTGPIASTPTRLVLGAGLGLIGIAERAALFGGEADVGPTPEGGFRVRVRLQRESVLV